LKAVVQDRYGPPEVLRIEEVEKPTPAEDEVLIRVRASTVNRTDCHRRAAKPFLWRLFEGLRRPKHRIPGSELAGEVVAVGAAVKEFAVGDPVFGLSGPKLGAHAEYICQSESGLIAPKPEALSFEEAAAVPDGALSALAGLRRAGVREGTRLLVYGASGSIGTAAVQLARHLGADVTAVANTKTLELVRSLGADRVLDYTQEDFRQNGQTYEVIFDAVGKLRFGRCKASLAPGGVFAATDGLWHFPLALWTSRFGDKRVSFAVPNWTKEDLVFVQGLVETGAYRPVVDRRYPLEDVVEASRYVETGQKTGNVVLAVQAV
jgi:NADPH:quinone reductase-like Zn-dependent oxidoreductase